MKVTRIINEEEVQEPQYLVVRKSFGGRRASVGLGDSIIQARSRARLNGDMGDTETEIIFRIDLME